MVIKFDKLDEGEPITFGRSKFCIFCECDLDTGLVFKYQGNEICICNKCLLGIVNRKVKIIWKTEKELKTEQGTIKKKNSNGTGKTAVEDKNVFKMQEV